MNYYHNPVNTTFPPCVIALGKFDGIHVGHRKLIDEVIKRKSEELKSAVFTFDKSILEFNDPDLLPIMREEERIRLFEELGIDYMASYTFDDNLMNMTREEFTRDILIGRLSAKVVVIGEDFRFGKGREGSALWLKEMSSEYGIEVVIVPDVTEGEIRVSSSMIREYLSNGDIVKANEMLGRPYSIEGQIIHGRELGRTIGIPTTNVRMPAEQFVPLKGVYITKNYIDGEVIYGVTNIGFKPTVNGHHLLAETNLFNFYKDVYDRMMKIELLEFIRPEKKFGSVMELQSEMENNILYAQNYVKKRFN